MPIFNDSLEDPFQSPSTRHRWNRIKYFQRFCFLGKPMRGGVISILEFCYVKRLLQWKECVWDASSKCGEAALKNRQIDYFSILGGGRLRVIYPFLGGYFWWRHWVNRRGKVSELFAWSVYTGLPVYATSVTAERFSGFVMPTGTDSSAVSTRACFMSEI